MHKKWYRSALVILLGAMSMVIGAKVHFDLLAVPITLQTFFLCLTALYFRPGEAAAAQLVYLLAGLFGPVFSESYYGVDILTGDSAGYLYGFIPAAWLISRYGKSRDYFAVLSWTMIGQALILSMGYLWLIAERNYDPDKALYGGVYVLLPGAFAKGILASAFYVMGEKFLTKKESSDET